MVVEGRQHSTFVLRVQQTSANFLMLPHIKHFPTRPSSWNDGRHFPNGQRSLVYIPYAFTPTTGNTSIFLNQWES